MSTIAASGPVASNSKKTSHFAAKLIASAAILTVAGLFVLKYALRYYLNYNAPAFADQGAPNFWSLRGWLMMHITGGMTALLTGPFQFWTGFRVRYAGLHRWMGRIFLCGVAVGSIGAFRMAIGHNRWLAVWSFSPGTRYRLVHFGCYGLLRHHETPNSHS